MSNSVFPTLPGLAWGVKRKPMWKTNVRESASGREYRSTSWTAPRWEYTLSYEFLRQGNGRTELNDLLGFFNKHYGAWDSWLYTDPDDNTATNVQFATADGLTNQFQILRSLGGNLEPVYAFVGTPTVTANGTALSVVVGANGLVTVSPTPSAGAVMRWTGSYYVRCRFSDDYIDPSKFMRDLYDLRQVRFITVKP